jgi:hypothetical protein
MIMMWLLEEEGGNGIDRCFRGSCFHPTQFEPALSHSLRSTLCRSRISRDFLPEIYKSFRLSRILGFYSLPPKCRGFLDESRPQRCNGTL